MAGKTSFMERSRLKVCSHASDFFRIMDHNQHLQACYAMLSVGPRGARQVCTLLDSFQLRPLSLHIPVHGRAIPGVNLKFEFKFEMVIITISFIARFYS